MAIRAISGALAAMFVVTAVLVPQAAAAPNDDIYCVAVKNRVGWDVAGATVRLVVAGPSAINAPQIVQENRTDARGEASFLVGDLISSTFLRTVNVTPDGSVQYRPRVEPVSVVADDVEDGACGGIEAAHVAQVELDAPGQGFLSVRVSDRLTQAPLVGAEVVTPGFRAFTNSTGVARIACLAGAQTAVVNISADGYLGALSTAICDASAREPTPVPAPLWRRPVVVNVLVTDEESSTGPTSIQAGLESVNVSVLSVPPSIADGFDRTAESCVRDVDASAIPNFLVDLDEGGSAAAAAEVPYLCYAESDANGLAQLRLPWTSDGRNYGLRAAATPRLGHALLALTRADAAPATPVAPGAPDPNDLQGTTLRVPGAVHLRIPLATQRVPFTLAVTDLAGAHLPSVPGEIDGPENRVIATDGLGYFHANLTPSATAYTLTIHSSAHNPRTCGFTVTLDGIAGLTPRCGVLLDEGDAAVNGTVTSGGVPVPNATVTLVGTSQNYTTKADANGTYLLNAPAGTGYKMNASQVGFLGTETTAFALPLDVYTRKDIDLKRGTRCVAIDVKSGATPLALANITIRHGGALKQNLTTGVDGRAIVNLTWDQANYSLTAFRDLASPLYAAITQNLTVGLGPAECESGISATLQLSLEPMRPQNVTVGATIGNVWTALPANISAKAVRDTNANVSCPAAQCNASYTGEPATLMLGANHTYIICADVASAAFRDVCTTTAIGPSDTLLNLTSLSIHVRPVNVVARDAHFPARVPNSTTFAKRADATPCGPLDDCVGPALGLTEGIAFRVCVAENTLYRETCVDYGANENGASATVNANRKIVNVKFKVVDAHATGTRGISGVTVVALGNASDPFVCAPTADYDCDTNLTNNAGTPLGLADYHARLPRVDADDACFKVAGRSFEIQPATAQYRLNPNPSLDNATLLDAWRCLDDGAEDLLNRSVTGSAEIEVRMVHAPTAPISGTVVYGVNGTTFVGAKVIPTSNRPATPVTPGMNCQPVDPHANETYPDCAGVLVGANGFTLRLPEMGNITANGQTRNDTTWLLTMSATGHFEEFINVTAGTEDVRVDMMPTEFELVLDARVLGSSDPCLPEASARELLYVVRNPVLQQEYRNKTTSLRADCTVRVVVSWVRDPSLWTPDSVHAVNASGNAFLITATAGDQYIGGTVGVFGPANAAVAVDMVAADGSGGPEPVQREWRVVDGDRRPGFPAPEAPQDGVPAARIQATRVGDPCAGAASTTTSVSGPTGAATLVFPCPGTYTVVVTAPPGYTAPASFVASTEETSVTVELDRASGGTVTFVSPTADLAPFPGIVPSVGREITLTGRDVDATMTVAVSGDEAVFSGLPWGIYDVTSNGEAAAGPTTIVIAPAGDLVVPYVFVETS